MGIRLRGRAGTCKNHQRMWLRLAAVVTLLLAGTARAQVATEGLSASELEQRSRAHFGLARSHLELKEYDAAIHEFEIGYQYKPLPLFLYNIAQVAVLEGKRSMALDYFQRYLAANPKAREKDEVTRRIAELKSSLAAEPEPTPEPAPAAPAVSPANDSSASGAAPSGTVSSPALSLSGAPAPPPKKKSNKAWIAVGIVGGVLVIGAAVAIGLTQAAHNDSGYNDWGTLVVNGRH
jgi:tetratricopeptide (TPR) repeat protein